MWPFEKQRCGPEALTLLPNVPVQTQGDGRWKGTKCKDHCETSRRGLGLSLCAGGVFNHAVKWVVVGICWKEDEMHAACHYFQMYNNTCSLYSLPLLLATFAHLLVYQSFSKTAGPKSSSICVLGTQDTDAACSVLPLLNQKLCTWGSMV